jgi:neural Wiskott-Aldrich syndrome protein
MVWQERGRRSAETESRKFDPFPTEPNVVVTFSRLLLFAFAVLTDAELSAVSAVADGEVATLSLSPSLSHMHACQTQVLASGVARLYKAAHGSWSYTQLMGAVLLVKESGAHRLKLVNLDAHSVDWTQELYEGFDYAAATSFLHTFEGDDACFAFSFAVDCDAAAFRAAVLSAAPANASTSAKLAPTVSARGPPPRVPPAGVTLSPPRSPAHDDEAPVDAAPAAAAAAAAVEKTGGSRFGFKGMMGTVRGLKNRVLGEKEPDVEISAPRDFRHLSSIGWTPENGFEIRNIPPEWRKLFQAAGVKKSELQDKDTAAFVMDIIQKEGGMDLLNASAAASDTSAAPSTPAPPAPPAPPPAPSVKAPIAPPPPPSAKKAGNDAAPAAASGPPRGGLLDQIKLGKELKSVDSQPAPAAAVPPPSGVNLADTLAKAMAARRGALEQKPAKSSVLDDDGDEEWSDK